MRVNVLQGRQSINCENSVFPAFMGRPSLEKGRANRHQLQTDTTQNRRKTVIGQMLRSDSFGKLRTVVGKNTKRFIRPATPIAASASCSASSSAACRRR